MIYDCFTFFNEFDILDIRFEELDPVVDKFVVVESNQTFSGKPKPYYFIEEIRKGRWNEYVDKIIHVPHHMPKLKTSWEREYRQRNAIASFRDVWHPQPHDYIMIGDADEIPRRSSIENMQDELIQGFGLPAYYYSINRYGGHSHTNRVVAAEVLNSMTPQQIRTLDHDSIPITWDAGWHFSYLGDVDHIIKKFGSFAHTELDRVDTNDPETLTARMSAGMDLWGDGHFYEKREVDDTWPEAIKRDRDRWRKFEW